MRKCSRASVQEGWRKNTEKEWRWRGRERERERERLSCRFKITQLSFTRAAKSQRCYASVFLLPSVNRGLVFRSERVLLWLLTSIQLVVVMNGAASPLQHHRILFIITSRLRNCCIMDSIPGGEAAC